jgi:hypothetical protein
MKRLLNVLAMFILALSIYTHMLTFSSINGELRYLKGKVDHSNDCAWAADPGFIDVQQPTQVQYMPPYYPGEIVLSTMTVTRIDMINPGMTVSTTTSLNLNLLGLPAGTTFWYIKPNSQSHKVPANWFWKDTIYIDSGTYVVINGGMNFSLGKYIHASEEIDYCTTTSSRPFYSGRIP